MALAALFFLVVAYQLWSIQSDLTGARSASDDLSLEGVQRAGGLSPAVHEVTRAVLDAEATADSPLLGALRPIPLLGDQIEGLRHLTDVVAVVAREADAEVAKIEERLDETGDPGGRVALVEAAIASVESVRKTVAQLPDVSDNDLIGPLRDASQELDAELDDADEKLDELLSHLDSARDLLDGPTRILVLAANNGEVRAGMGMHLSAGLITLENGDITTSPFFPTGELTKITDGRVEVSDELRHLYSSIWGFGHEWRTTSSTPNFPVVGSVFSELAELTPLGEMDAVLSIDVPALANILRATGPVEVDSDVVSADNAVELLLRENYLRVDEAPNQSERYQLQSRVATVILETVTDRDIDLFDVASAIKESATGRNLLAWSANPGTQALWELLGADGSISSSSFLVAFQNASASKRDYFITPSVTITPVEKLADGSRRFRIDATLENPVVEPSAPYFESLNQYVPDDVHRAWVTFTLPKGARDIEVLSGRHSRTGTDGPTVVAAVWLRVRVGEVGSASIEVTMPADVRAVDLIPSARVNPTPYRFGPVEVLDTEPRRVGLPLVASFEPLEAKPFHALTLVFGFLGIVVLVARSRRLEAAGVDDEKARASARVDVYTAAAIFALGVGSLALAIAS